MYVGQKTFGQMIFGQMIFGQMTWPKNLEQAEIWLKMEVINI